jgi:hypothetical protein
MGDTVKRNVLCFGLICLIASLFLITCKNPAGPSGKDGNTAVDDNTGNNEGGVEVFRYQNDVGNPQKPVAPVGIRLVSYR